DVDAHRAEAITRSARNLRRIGDFLVESEDAAFAVDFEDAEAFRVALRDHDRADGQRGAVLEVTGEHPPIIHAVDVVAREDEDVARLLLLDRVDVLVDRVGRAAVPLLATPVVRRARADELLEPSRQEVPAEADVLLERPRLVLRED